MSRQKLLNVPAWTWEKLTPWLGHPQLTRRLVFWALVLSSPALFLDFYLDDHIGRYVYSDLPGAARLYRNYSSGYGLAIGDPVESQWQMESGWAPWWQYPHLRLAMFRPVGVLLHTFDFRVLPDIPVFPHAHNLLWLALTVVAVTAMYRKLLGALVGGAAALLFTFDHTHGFVVGHICNRHALVATLLGALILMAHVHYRRTDVLRHAWAGPLLYVLSLLTSESSIAIAGYVLAFELFVPQEGWRRRAFAAAPYAAITLIWRVLYDAAGYGASGSRFYIDVGREPLRYALAFLERGPLFMLGQFSVPPSEMYYELPAELAQWVFGWALVVVGIVIWAVVPVLRQRRMARFWALGMVGSFIPAATTDPANRQLILASLGAMGLLAETWQFYATSPQAGAARSPAYRWANGFAVLVVGFRLTVSPALLPSTTATIAFTAPIHTSASAFGNEAAGRDLIFVTAPYEFTIRMVQLFKRIDGEPLPRRIRTISCGPQKTTLRRTGPRTLEVAFENGLFKRPELGLHRDPRLKMPPGTKVRLEGFLVEVLHTTEHDGPDLARFTFDKPLEDPSLAFYRWGQRRFVPFTPPPIGAEVVLPGAVAPLTFE